MGDSYESFHMGTSLLGVAEEQYGSLIWELSYGNFTLGSSGMEASYWSFHIGTSLLGVAE